MKNIKLSDIWQVIQIEYGDKLVLVDVDDKEHAISYNEYVRNIYRVNKDGELIWQIKSDDDYNKEMSDCYDALFYPYCVGFIRDTSQWPGDRNQKYYPVDVSHIWAYRGLYMYAIDLKIGHAEMMFYNMKR